MNVRSSLEPKLLKSRASKGRHGQMGTASSITAPKLRFTRPLALQRPAPYRTTQSIHLAISDKYTPN